MRTIPKGSLDSLSKNQSDNALCRRKAHTNQPKLQCHGKKRRVDKQKLKKKT